MQALLPSNVITLILYTSASRSVKRGHYRTVNFPQTEGHSVTETLQGCQREVKRCDIQVPYLTQNSTTAREYRREIQLVPQYSLLLWFEYQMSLLDSYENYGRWSLIKGNQSLRFDSPCFTQSPNSFLTLRFLSTMRCFSSNLPTL